MSRVARFLFVAIMAVVVSGSVVLGLAHGPSPAVVEPSSMKESTFGVHVDIEWPDDYLPTCWHSID